MTMKNMTLHRYDLLSKKRSAVIRRKNTDEMLEIKSGGVYPHIISPSPLESAAFLSKHCITIYLAPS